MELMDGACWQTPEIREKIWIFPIFFLPSAISRSRISQAKMVGCSRLYCSILATTTGVATLGLVPTVDDDDAF